MDTFNETLKSVLMHHELSDVPAKQIHRWEGEGGFIPPSTTRIETSRGVVEHDHSVGGGKAV